MAFVVPLLIQAARMVATRYVARAAAARVASGAAAGRLGTAALRGRQYMQSPAANVSLLRNVPGLRRAAAQPRLFGRGTATNPTIWSRFNQSTRTRNLPIQTSAAGRPYVSVPSGTTRVQWSGSLPSGSSTVPVTMRGPVSTATRLRQTAASPVRGLTRLATPRNLAAEAEFTAYALAADAANRSAQNNESSSPRPTTSSATPYAPTTPRAPTWSPYQPTAPAQPSTPWNPYGIQPPASSAGNRPRGNQPTTITPGSPLPSGPGLNPTPPRVFTPPPASAPRAPAPDAAAANREDFERELGRLQSTYAGLVDQIRGAYNLAPTEEEKQLLLDDLADLEAENESAKLALAALFAEKDKTISAIEAKSRQMTTERAQGIGQLYSEAGQNLSDLDAARRAAVAASTPGYGAAIGRDSNIDAELLATLAPMAQGYAQDIGDIGSQGLQYVLGLTQGVGAARQGELQSAYAGRRAAIRGDWSERVADRIANERLQMANNLSSLAERQLSAASAMSRAGQDEGFTAADIDQVVSDAALEPAMTEDAFIERMSRYGLPVDEYVMERFRALKAYYDEIERQNSESIEGLSPEQWEFLNNLLEQQMGDS